MFVLMKKMGLFIVKSPIFGLWLPSADSNWYMGIDEGFLPIRHNQFSTNIPSGRICPHYRYYSNRRCFLPVEWPG